VPELSCLGLFQPSAWKASDGTLWFATRRGVLNTDPALVPEDADLPPVTVAEIRSDGHKHAVAEELRIETTVRKTEVRFSVLNLTAPDRTFVRYRLEGFDDDWVLSRDRTAVYPRLPAGRYVLLVSASSGSGAWEEQAPVLTIVVRPAWWQSGWARVLFVLAGIGVVGAVVRAWSLRRWRRRLEKLEREQAVERERTRIAQDIHDDMGASLTRISLLSQSAGAGTAPPVDVLEQIYETTHAITRSMDEIVWAINPKFDDLESLVYYLTTFAQKFLSAAKLRFRLEAPDTLPAVAVNTQVRHHVFLCCKEAINNVVKHARATEVTLTVALADGVLTVSVADDGRGSKDAEPRGGAERILSGHGIGNMRQRMNELGGTCTVEMRAPQGTTIRFAIPLASTQAGKNDAPSPLPR
jgi:signal transduction histidine kinase